MASFVVRNGQRKVICYNKIVRCAQNSNYSETPTEVVVSFNKSQRSWTFVLGQNDLHPNLDNVTPSVSPKSVI